MKKLLHLIFIVLCVSSISVLSADTTTILAFGDSITAKGGRGFVTYRHVLIPELRNECLDFEFIGPKRDHDSAYAGYGGKNTSYLLSISEEVYSQYPADIVMIHSGHNSFSKDDPVAGIVRDTELIMKNMRSINPDVIFLLAQVIPAGKLPKYSYIPDLNEELAALATRLTEQGYNIILVDQADGFDWKEDTISDMVHPNPSGAKKMADKWMQALLPLLDIKDVKLVEADS
ncbi:GDSL-type esterase/lipase family protein [Coraliomargarita sp. SDUM461004]|uniref:GDSL-type esterase/lipase family protein n=1 Tax=Thalassobacterium sedimentorum TaxID=3041258 RepID=A0ABU1AJA2_9BACT|nr:GDSL-type esterase/lipase family protein [Coraliomargarita sp. SDUM461004]MDQ8194782.1 GDSL-type esterase/lipase family protein [Coraliomargarita sp. SDUM461004]